MCLSLAFCCLFLLLGSVEAIKIDLKESCDLDSPHCTISDFHEDMLIIDKSEIKYNFTELIFRSCYLPSLPVNLFHVVPKLERILLYKCSTKGLEQNNFLLAGNLRHLYLPNNRLTELTEKVFVNLIAVEEIRLNHNHISQMHAKAFAGLAHLRVLKLNNNKIHELTSGVFSNLTNLEFIDLSYNDLDALDSKVFETNLKLKSVLLNNNNFAIFESNSLTHLSHLSVLDISYNTIPAIQLQSVDTLHAQNSQLRSCVINGSVIKIRASNNQLTSISISDKSSPKEIDLHSNLFESLSDFNGMLNLQKLDISKNFIHFLNDTNTSRLLDLPSLQSLNAAYGHLQSLNVENFMLLRRLVHLDLAYNKLHFLDADGFEPLENLEKLYFEENNLYSFDYEAFIQSHQKMKEMGIFGNAWSSSYLKKMSDVLKANDIELVIRFNTNGASEMISLQTTSHPHHTVHAKTIDQVVARRPGVNNRDILVIVTLCLVLLILMLQLFRILKDENVFASFNQRISRTIRPTRLDEEESEPL